MQKVAAYLLERRGGMFDANARNAEAAKLRGEVWKWVQSKGAPVGARSGSYHAEDGSQATFTSEEADDAGRSWSIVQLGEVTAAGRRFVASVSVTTARESVAVYASLEAASDAFADQPGRSSTQVPTDRSHAGRVARTVESRGLEPPAVADRRRL